MERIKTADDMPLPREFDEVKPNNNLICYLTDIIGVQTLAVSEPEIRRSRAWATGTKSPPASSTYERVEHLHRENILFRHWCLARAAAKFVHKKSLTGSTPPGTYPVAHDDPLTLISIYTHAMEWLPQVFKGTRQMHFNPLRKPSILVLTMRDQILMNRYTD